MKRSRLYRFVLLVAAGGALFQAGNVSCQKQIAQTFGTSFAEALAPALVDWLTTTLPTGASTTQDTGSTT
jgi:hypothetical protein